MNRFKRARLIVGLTQVELAKMLGVTTASVQKWESGECMPTVKRLKKVAGALQTTVADLLEGDEKRAV